MDTSIGRSQLSAGLGSDDNKERNNPPMVNVPAKVKAFDTQTARGNATNEFSSQKLFDSAVTVHQVWLCAVKDEVEMIMLEVQHFEAPSWPWSVSVLRPLLSTWATADMTVWFSRTSCWMASKLGDSWTSPTPYPNWAGAGENTGFCLPAALCLQKFV